MKIRQLTVGAVIAALYVVLTFLANAMGLANHVIQVRFSEALCILPYFTPVAIPGVTVGCFISNLIIGSAPPDLLFGTLATLLGALCAYLLRFNKWLVPFPTVLSNTLIIPFVLRYAYGMGDAIWFMMITVCIGELISVGVLGMLLLFTLKKHQATLFR